MAGRSYESISAKRSLEAMTAKRLISPRSRAWPERLLTTLSTFVRVFIVLVVIGWILSAGNLRDIATQQPDPIHSFPVQQHGSIFYTRPALGKVYVNFPWLLAGSLLVALLTDYLQRKQVRKRS